MRTWDAVFHNFQTHAGPPDTGACYLLPAQTLTLCPSSNARRYEQPATASFSPATGSASIHIFRRKKCSGALWCLVGPGKGYATCEKHHVADRCGECKS